MVNVLGKTAVIIPIYKPDSKFNQLLHMLKKQKKVPFDVYIIDSGSRINDYQRDLDGLSYRIVKTTPQEFNHGKTRRDAAENCKDYSYLVFMTQDAIPVDEFSISNLLKAFQNPSVGCAYGRHLPHKDANIFATKARLFNYPNKSCLKGYFNINKLGIKTSFISDTFAAYRVAALKEIGGFPEDVILGEDTYVASKMIISKWVNAYVADAQVFHSHNYSILQEFRRYFDTGVFHSREPWIRKFFGEAEGEGKRFVITELTYLFYHGVYRIPEAIFRDGCKFLAYKMGLNEKYIPVKIKRKCSMMKTYWK